MLVLAIDTCDARGGVALLRGGDLVGVLAHTTAENYSSWLLPAVDKVLRKADVRMADLDGS